MPAYPILPYRCPYCGKLQDSTYSPNADRAPMPHDTRICIDCCGLCRVERGQAIPVKLEDLHPLARQETETLINLIELTRPMPWDNDE